jgi:4,5-DOPA dioxygenase extradiol
MPAMLPTLFISHGSPMTALMDSPARHFLETLGKSMTRPRAIVVASAHWETQRPAVTAPKRNTTIHDFSGFPPALFALEYNAPGDPELAGQIAARLTEIGLPASLAPARGLDHGAWVPLLLAYPEADIPVLQLSIQTPRGPRHHMVLGAALAFLREQNILVIGSGSFTHDLGRFRNRPELDAPEAPDVTEFATWMDEKILAGDFVALVDYRARAPHAGLEHPTEEHLLPLFVALGAAGEKPIPTRLHSSIEFGILRMDTYAFN